MDKALKNLTLALFFTGGTSLTDWAEKGNLERELAIYHRMAEKLKKVNLVTYGGKNDKRFADRIGKLNLIPANWYSRPQLTALNLALRYSPRIMASDILKTNQIRGARIPVWLNKVYRKKLIVRCGFLHSYFTRQQTGDERRIHDAVALERMAFRASDLAIVTSDWQSDLIIEDYALDPDKVKVLPNYVVTDVFKPNPGVEKKYDLLFIGRDARQKNLENLLKAVDQLGKAGKKLSLLLVGSCCQNSELKRIVTDKGLNVTFKSQLPSFELPRVINQTKIFILPSLYEGHPKALLEAMSCGAACIGTDVVGINNVIGHLENGYLCRTDYQSLAKAITEVLNNKDLRKKTGRKAREYIVRNFDIEKVLQMEFEAIEELK